MTIIVNDGFGPDALDVETRSLRPERPCTDGNGGDAIQARANGRHLECEGARRVARCRHRGRGCSGPDIDTAAVERTEGQRGAHPGEAHSGQKIPTAHKIPTIPTAPRTVHALPSVIARRP